MTKTIKCLEYYVDSKKYTDQEIIENIIQTKKDFGKKDVDVEVELNDFGVYVITFYFKCRNSFFTELILKIKAKIQLKKRLLIDSGNKKDIKSVKLNNDVEYGKYKKITKEYRPY